MNVFTVFTGFANAGAAVDANAAAVTAASGTVTADHAEFILVYYNTTNSKVQMTPSALGDAAEDHADASYDASHLDNIVADGIAAALLLVTSLSKPSPLPPDSESSGSEGSNYPPFGGVFFLICSVLSAVVVMELISLQSPQESIFSFS